jgi:hypothetical protein
MPNSEPRWQRVPLRPAPKKTYFFANRESPIPDVAQHSAFAVGDRVIRLLNDA